MKSLRINSYSSFSGLSGLGVGSVSRNYVSASVLVLGVFIGSALWWFTLSAGIGMFRARLNPAGLRWVNKISGTIIMGFGLLAFVSLI